MEQSSDTDGTLRRGYTVRCSMPHCTSFRAVNSSNLSGRPTKKKAVKILRSEGWSNREVLGWTCWHHNEHEQQKATKAGRSAMSLYGYP